MVEFLIQVAREEGIAIVAMVEHIMRAVVNMAQKVIVLDYGEKIVDAPTEEALTDPRVVDVYLGRKEESGNA
jgi:branched-chain amino acid transport system ATP-binding protein